MFVFNGTSDYAAIVAEKGQERKENHCLNLDFPDSRIFLIMILVFELITKSC